MQDSSNNQLRRVLEAAIALAPWVVSMYLLYWLEYGKFWTTATPHRGKLSVLILAVGMVASFLVQSRFASRRRK